MDKLIPLVQKLIQKQINKSQLNKVQFLVTMYRMYLNLNIVDFSFGLMLTEMYSIPRMFKKFDPKKHSRNDQCSKKNVFQNIIYVGGSSHGDYISRFINLYFNNEYQNEIIVKTTELKKKINSLGNKRMYQELCDVPLEDNKEWDELVEQVQYRCVELKSPRSFF